MKAKRKRLLAALDARLAKLDRKVETYQSGTNRGDSWRSQEMAELRSDLKLIVTSINELRRDLTERYDSTIAHLTEAIGHLEQGQGYLSGRVDDHEKRLNHHETRITTLEVIKK